jgi:hypothetical protein
MWSPIERARIQDSPKVGQKARCMIGPSDLSTKQGQLPRGGGDGLGFAELRDNAELLH